MLSRIWRAGLAVALVYGLVPGGLARPAQVAADGGDYSLDFVAAAPFTYDRSVGGGAFNDRTIGKSADVVESLEGADFECGDIVTYLTEIAVDDLAVGGSAHTTETIQLDYTLGAEATNGTAVGHIDVVGVAVNYGSVVNGAGAGGTDSGMNDDGGSTATLIAERFTSGATPDGSYPEPQEENLIATIEIDDFESFETVILRFDVLLGCGSATGTGNVQAKLSGKRVVEADGEPFDDSIPGGAQTIPFQSLSNEPPVAPAITVVKSNDADKDGQFGDTETAAPGVPVTVTYQVSVTNDAPDPVEIQSATDDTHDIGGSTCAALVGTVLDPGQTITCTFDVTFVDDGESVTNIFSVTASNENGQATDDDASTVIIPELLPVIVVVKSAAPSVLPESGGEVTYSVSVSNESAEGLVRCPRPSRWVARIRVPSPSSSRVRRRRRM